jgi:2-iminobutanoate/2-iminopropanoate deaminase
MPKSPLLPVVALLLAGCATATDSAAPRFHPSPDPARRALPFSESVEAGGFLYVSGAIGTAPGTFDLVPGGIAAESRATMENLRLALERRGCTFADVVKCTVFLVDMAEWPAFNEVYATFFDGRFPARSALGASGLARGARVEVECIAKLPAGR